MIASDWKMHDLREFDTLLPDSADLQPFAHTGFGDLFVVHRQTQAVHFLEVQRLSLEFVDRRIEWVLSEFLRNGEVAKHVLRQEILARLIEQKGALVYGEIFILEPWEMFGGLERVEAYEKGDLPTYLALVAQSVGE